MWTDGMQMEHNASRETCTDRMRDRNEDDRVRCCDVDDDDDDDDDENLQGKGSGMTGGIEGQLELSGGYGRATATVAGCLAE